MPIATGDDALASDVNAALNARLSLAAGGTLGGPLFLFRDPQSSSEAATKNYVDNSASAPASSSDWLNIKTDFGAAGDGKTDDTAAIQKAITGTPTGGALFWPAGTYVTTGTFAVNKAATWVGSGRQSTTISVNNAAGGTFTFNQCMNLSDMAVVGGVTMNSSSGYLLTWNGANATRSRIRNIWMSGFGNGIFFNGPSDVILHDAQMFNWAGGGVAINYTGGIAAVFDQLVIQQGAAPGLPNSVGIKVLNGGITINNSQVMGCGTPLQLAPGTGQAVVSMWVMNTGFDSSNNAMVVHPVGNGGVARCWFVGCWFGGSSGSGVTIASPSKGMVDGIDFDNCHVLGNGLHGIEMQDANAINLSFTNCQIAGNQQTGLQFFAGGSQFLVSGCRIGPYGGFGANGHGGINLGGVCTNYRIVDNDLYNGGINPLIGVGVQGGNKVGIEEIITRNKGYVDRNSGWNTWAANQTANHAAIYHGLAAAPAQHDIFLTMMTGSRNPVQFMPYVQDVNSNYFDLYLGDAGANQPYPISISWSAKLPCTPK